MKKLSTLILVSIATLGLTAAGCKKKDDNAAPATGSGSAMAGSDTMAGSGSAGSAMAGSDTAGSGMAGSDTAGSGMAGSAAGSGSAAAADTADKLEIVADHIDAAKGPVSVVFTGIKVVKADFDPAKIEGGTAELEIDLTTLSSGIEKRDTHLKSADYIETDKNATANVTVKNVKKSGDSYTADATVKMRGVDKTFPVTFTVAESGPDWVRINGESKFSRLDFKVGKEEKDDTVKADLTAKLTVTLKKT